MGKYNGWQTRHVGLSIFLAALAVLFACRPCTAQSPQVLLGKAAPPFVIESGDGKRLTLDALAGKVAVIFYETRETSQKNGDIKDRLNKLYDRQDERLRQSIARVPVFNCSKLFWPVTLVWRESLKKHSRRVGMTLYGDWDGRMALNYHMKDRESNVLILDRSGTVRYAGSGRISEEQYAAMEELLDRLINQEK